MKIISCRVTDEYVQGGGVVVGAAGSHDDVALCLEFSPIWDGTSKSITWMDARGENPTLTLLTASMRKSGSDNVYIVPIPASPKAFAGQMMMTIKGVTVEGAVETSATVSATAYFTILESRLSPSAEAEQDIPPTQAEQLHAEIEKQVERIENMTAEAARGTDAGVTVDVGEDAIHLSFTLPKGDTGATGEKGEAGGYYTPAVDSAGNLSWSASKSGMPGVSGVNIKGEKGDTGDKGEKGEKGDQGIQGIQGEKGDTGASGTYIGDAEPTDPDVDVWIQPDGDECGLLLPVVTSEDDGKIPMVVDGAWSVTPAPIVSGHRLTDMTYEEFEAAVKDPDTYYFVYEPEATQ